MQKAIILNKQNLLDLGIQLGGKPEMSFDIALENDISITQILTPNTEILIPQSELLNADIKGYYDRKQIKPATATIPEIYSALGIGEMGIEYTFKVR